jgi:hypothetical protein
VRALANVCDNFEHFQASVDVISSTDGEKTILEMPVRRLRKMRALGRILLFLSGSDLCDTHRRHHEVCQPLQWCLGLLHNMILQHVIVEGDSRKINQVRKEYFD